MASTSLWEHVTLCIGGVIASRHAHGMFVSAGNRINYILAGQHNFAAATMLRQEMLRDNVPIPEWLKWFTCRRVKHTCTLEQRQLVARRAPGTMATDRRRYNLHELLGWFLREYGRGLSTTVQNVRYGKEILQDLYVAAGCNRYSDGTMVCLSSVVALLVVPWCIVARTTEILLGSGTPCISLHMECCGI